MKRTLVLNFEFQDIILILQIEIPHSLTIVTYVQLRTLTIGYWSAEKRHALLNLNPKHIHLIVHSEMGFLDHCTRYWCILIDGEVE